MKMKSLYYFYECALLILFLFCVIFSASAAPRDDESVGSSINTSPDQRTGNENLLRDNGTDASLFSGIPILNNLFAASRVRTGSGFNENSPLNSPIANNNNNPANNYRPSTAGKELSNMGSNMEITIADFFMLQLPTNVDASATKKDVYPKDLYIMDLHGRVYNAMEVFGLNAVNDQANKPTTAVSPERPSSASSRGSGPSTKSSPKGSKRIAATDDDQSSQSSNDVSTIEPAEIRVRGVKRTKVADEENATSGTGDNAAQNNTTSPGLMISQGGKFPRDECVVCLTEAKEILLLPCR